MSIQNEEVSSSHLFVGCDLPELSQLRGLADVSVGNHVAGAITLSGSVVLLLEMFLNSSSLINRAGEERKEINLLLFC